MQLKKRKVGLTRPAIRRVLAVVGAGALLAAGISAGANAALPVLDLEVTPSSPIMLNADETTTDVTLNVSMLGYAISIDWQYRVYSGVGCSDDAAFGDWVKLEATEYGQVQQSDTVALGAGTWSIGAQWGSEFLSPEACTEPITVTGDVAPTLTVSAEVAAENCPATGGIIAGDVTASRELEGDVTVVLDDDPDTARTADWDEDSGTYKYLFDGVDPGIHTVTATTADFPDVAGESDPLTIVEGVCAQIVSLPTRVDYNAGGNCPVSPDAKVTVSGTVANMNQEDEYSITLALGGQTAEDVTVEADGSFSHVFNVAEDGEYQLQATLLTNRTPSNSVVGNVVVAMEECPVPAFADMTITASAPTCPATTGSFAVEGRLDDAYPDTEIVVRLLDQEGEEVQSNQVKLGEDSSFEVIMSGIAAGDYQVEYSQFGMEETVIGTEDVSMGDCTPADEPEDKPVDKPGDKPAAKPGDQLPDTGASEIALWATWSVVLLGAGGALVASRRRKSL